MRGALRGKYKGMWIMCGNDDITTAMEMKTRTGMERETQADHIPMQVGEF